MRATRLTRPTVNLLALALALAATSLPATAQSGSEAIVCVGSENRSLQTNPVRRIYTEDMEIVYRVGVDIGQRDRIEPALRSELGSYPEVSCAWSDPGDDHAVIISYTGVIRQDLTVDPEDTRYQAFSVGFGTGFDEAEARATTNSQRFRRQNDGSGYEVLLTETWGERAVAAGGATEPSVPEGRICTEDYSPESCWMELADRPGCYLWNPVPQENVTVTWSRGCSGGYAQGNGRVSWYQNGELIQTEDTDLQDGHRNGPDVVRDGDGELLLEGTYVNGARHGDWIESYDDGARGEGPYVNGIPEGTWTYYYERGRADGLVRETGPFVDGERSGTWTQFIDYTERGGRRGRVVGPYVNNERHGIWITYDASGDEIGRQRWENGKPVGRGR